MLRDQGGGHQAHSTRHKICGHNQSGMGGIAMIEESYVSFDTAKLLKEAGFDAPCYIQYSDIGIQWDNAPYPENFNADDWGYSCPTQALAARWLREVHDIHVFTNYFFEDGTWFYVAVDLKESDEVRAIHPDIRSYQSSEEALEAGLQEAIKLIKSKDYEGNSL